MRFENISASSPKKSYILPQNAQNITLKNCLLKDGSIKVREGLFCDTDTQIFRRDNTVAEMSFICTDCYLYLDGRYGRVAVSVSDNLMGNIVYNMRLVFADGDVQDIGIIEFTRTSADQMGYPVSFTVFRGKATTGCGIYFISRQVYGGDIADFVRVMELNSSMDRWSLLSDSEIYKPILLANGRGEKYHSAQPLGEFLKLPDPVNPESPNLLCGGFYAYYTSDSASNKFMLPSKNLDNTSVICEVTVGDNIYKWVVPEGCLTSEMIEAEGQEVSVLCERDTGLVAFYKSDGSEWAPPYTGKMNGIRVTAYKTDADDVIKVASMSSCLRLDGNTTSDGSGITAFYGSVLHPSAVILNSPDAPLYFPKSSQYLLGETVQKTEKLEVIGNHLFAFKENEVYSARVNQYKGVSQKVTDIGAEENTGAYSLTFRKEITLTQKPNIQSIAVLGGNIIYVSLSGEIWRVSGTSSFKAEKIGSIEQTQGFAVICRDTYLLVDGNTATSMQITDKGCILGKWHFPENITAGISYLGNTALFAELFQGNEYIIYPLRFCGDTDTRLCIENGLVSVAEKKIDAGCRIGLFLPSYAKRRIFKVRADGQGEQINLTLYDKDNRLLSRKGAFLKGSAYFLCGCHSLMPEAVFDFAYGTEIDGIAVEYKELRI